MFSSSFLKLTKNKTGLRLEEDLRDNINSEISQNNHSVGLQESEVELLQGNDNFIEEEVLKI